MNMSEYKLTEEGNSYLAGGLPEKNLSDALSDGPLKFDDARRKVRNFDIAFLWCKKKGLIEIKSGWIHLVKKIVFEEQEALRKISQGADVPEEMLKVLIERKLVGKVSREVEALERQVSGRYIMQLTPEMIKTGVWKSARGFAPYNRDQKSQPRRMMQGKLHPYRQVINELRTKLVGMGFTEARGPYIESEFWNFDALFVPQDHPARSGHDAFIAKTESKSQVNDGELWDRVKATHEFGWITGSKGWGKWNMFIARNLVLRSQNTAVSARALAGLNGKLPFKMFALDRVFRYDVVDAKHLPDFDQCEGIIAGKDLNFRHLVGYLKEIGRVMGAEDVRIKPSYFPFTEPSAEMYVKMKDLGWVEVGGAGIFRPEVTAPLGVEVPVLAFGFGIGRLAMIRMNTSDIRNIYSHDVKWLREAVV